MTRAQRAPRAANPSVPALTSHALSCSLVWSLALSLAGLLAAPTAFAGERSRAIAQQTGAPATKPTPEPAPKPATLAPVLYSTRGDNKVHVLAADDLRLLASIDAQAGAHELAIDSTGRFALGSAFGGPGANHQPADNRLVVIDLAAGRRHRTITLDGIQRPNDIAFLDPVHSNGDAFQAVVTAEVPQHVLLVHAETGAVRPLPLADKHGHMLALAPDAKTVYVSHVAPGSVSFVDLATGEVGRQVPVSLGAEGIALSPDGALVAVSCPQPDEVAIFDARDAAHEVAKVRRVDTNLMDGKPIAGQMAATSIAFSPDGATLYAVCAGDEPSIVAIDVAKGAVRARVRSHGETPDALASGLIQWSGGPAGK
jgi:DNA-binding beta-propeller fold protein YncE